MKAKDQRTHIGIFGRTNTGKSSLINTLTCQNLSLVSAEPGTTTDPVKKTIEIPGIGAVVLIDTAGMDDTSVLGELRVRKSLMQIKAIDFAILTIDYRGFGDPERELLKQFGKAEIPCVVVYNKDDIQSIPSDMEEELRQNEINWCSFNCMEEGRSEKLIAMIRDSLPLDRPGSQSLLADLINPGDTVVLVTPIDEEAPEGRMILPQVQVIRDVLDQNAMVVVVKESELDLWLKNRNRDPALVITDSQAFKLVSALVPDSIPLTSFSILLARRKGNFSAFLEGTPKISELKRNDRILILESCTHHVACNDIGREKIPSWLTNFSEQELHFDVIAGLGDLPARMTDYALVIQCGGCVMTRRQVNARIDEAIQSGVPVSNYGMAIAWVHGIFNRAIEPFFELEQISFQ